MHDLAAQQVAGRSRMAGAFEEKPTGAKFVGIVGLCRGEKEEAGGLRGSPQKQQFNKDI